jgi:hypothetical protein
MASAGFTAYVERKLTSNPCVLRPQVHMSLLISAACGGQPALVKSLLAAGASPHDLVEGFWDWDSSLRVKHTVWHLFCTRFACRVMDRHWIQLDMRDECEGIQHFIEAGADFNCSVFLGRKTNGYQFDEARPTHAISLRVLIQQLDPPNVQVLLGLMGELKSARNSILSRIIGASWGSLVGLQPEPAPFHSADDYTPFDLTMDPLSMGEVTYVPSLPRLVCPVAERTDEPEFHDQDLLN